MADSKKADTKNQHYVPKFYQRFFSDNGKTIGAFALNKREYIKQASIKHQSSADYFYSDNQKIEDALSRLEDSTAEVFNKIISNPLAPLTKDDRLIAYVFTFFQIGRTLDRANFLQETSEVALKNLLNHYVKFTRQTENAAEVELLTDEVLKEVSIKLNQPAKFSLGTHAQLIDTCADLKLKVLINNTSIPFITSDNPACMYSMFLERVGEPTYALGSKGLIFYLPLNTQIALLFYDPLTYRVGDRKKHYVEITEQSDVENLNTLVACYANKMIYCRDGSITPYNLERLADAHDKYKPKNRVQPIDGITLRGNPLLGTVAKSIYCNLKLHFLKELTASKFITSRNYNPAKHRLRPSVK